MQRKVLQKLKLHLRLPKLAKIRRNIYNFDIVSLDPHKKSLNLTIDESGFS